MSKIKNNEKINDFLNGNRIFSFSKVSDNYNSSIFNKDIKHINHGQIWYYHPLKQLYMHIVAFYNLLEQRYPDNNYRPIISSLKNSIEELPEHKNIESNFNEQDHAALYVFKNKNNYVVSYKSGLPIESRILNNISVDTFKKIVINEQKLSKADKNGKYIVATDKNLVNAFNNLNDKLEKNPFIISYFSIFGK